MTKFNQIQPYPSEVIALSTFKGFVAIYFNFLRNDEVKTHQKAYEMVEILHKKFYGREKYSSFESFRVIKNRKIKEI